jgi:adenylate kinase
MKASKRIVLILLGRPGSGKDTQAELLAKKFGLVWLKSSEIIKKELISSKKTIELEGESYDIEKEREKQRNGSLNTFAFVAALVKNEIRKTAKAGKGLIMSGSPRSLLEFKEELPLFKELYGLENTYFFDVKISPKEVYIRNMKRHRKDLPELDTKKVITKRLKVFTHDTMPMVKYLKSKKMIFEVDGEQPIEKIHLDILKILEKEWLQ